VSAIDAVLGMAIEAVTVLSVGAVGFVLGRSVQGASTSGALTAEVCQCTHGSAFHDGNGCRAVVVETDPLTKIQRNRTCSCVHYVGPSTSYVPELDGPDGPLNGGWK
jgi:hypothetical protein